MEDKIEYKLLTGLGEDSLAREVMKFLSNGWELYGHPFHMKANRRDSPNKVAQAVIKKPIPEQEEDLGLEELKAKLSTVESVLRSARSNSQLDLPYIERLQQKELELKTENERLRKTLQYIARQETLDELTEKSYEDADFEGAYDIIVEKAREALQENKGA